MTSTEIYPKMFSAGWCAFGVAAPSSGKSKNFEKWGAEDNLSAPSSFIANAQNEIYAFTRKKAAF